MNISIESYAFIDAALRPVFSEKATAIATFTAVPPFFALPPPESSDTSAPVTAQHI